MTPQEPNSYIMPYLYGMFDSAIDKDGKPIRVVTYDGKDYPVYSVVPKNTSMNYIAMNPVEYVDDSTKDMNMYECTQLFDIVIMGSERGSWSIPNGIADEILKRITKQRIITQKFVSTVYPIVDSVISYTEEVESGLILRRLVRLRYNIQQIY